jgi:predicted DsbA family dithiol-disulfide isomerase
LIEQIAADLQTDSKSIVAGFKKMAADSGLTCCELKKIYNSGSAQELGFWAKSLHKEEQYHNAVFKAFYGEGADISNKQVLTDIVESINLSGIEAVKHLEMGTFKPQLNSDWKRAKDLKLVAAPTYLINNNKLVGAHPYKKLQHFIESNGAEKRVAAD